MITKGSVLNKARASGVFSAADEACDVFKGRLP